MAERRAEWLAFLRRLVRVGTLAALAGLVVEFGLPVDASVSRIVRLAQLGLIGLFALHTALALAWARPRLAHLRRHWLEIALLALILVDVALGLLVERLDVLGSAWFVGVQAYLLARALMAVARVQEWLTTHSVRPALLLVIGFASAAILGALLLLFPLARAPGAEPWTFTDAFFTSASAVCVTGLSVRDVGTQLSFRGQVVLLALIQLGGIGLVAIACGAALVERGRLHLREARAVAEMLGLTSPGRVRRVLAFALSATLVAEALGTLSLWLATAPGDTGAHDRLWWSAFHAVSAFCNAGFSLSATSLAPFAERPGILVPIAALVVLGGIGFTVQLDLLSLRPLSWTTLRWLRWRLWSSIHWPWTHAVFAGPVPHRLAVGTRLTLTTSLVLLGLGTVAYVATEAGRALAGASVGGAWLQAAFASVAARTAGFQTLDFATAALPTLLATLLLMVVGASPLSTGGGVKTTTLAVSMLTVRAMAKDREHVEAFGRTIPRAIVQACVAIVGLYVVLCTAVTLLLLGTQDGLRFEEALFESVSALSTVGLSMNVTPRLDEAGRWIVALAMIAGRVGPLACLWTLVSRRATLRYRYPEESLAIS